MCVEVCWLILQNKIKTDYNNSDFNYLKPELYHKLEELSKRIEDVDSEIVTVDKEFNKTIDENTLTSHFDYKETR